MKQQDQRPLSSSCAAAANLRMRACTTPLTKSQTFFQSPSQVLITASRPQVATYPSQSNIFDNSPTNNLRPQTCKTGSKFPRVQNAGRILTPNRNSSQYVIQRKVPLLSMKYYQSESNNFSQAVVDRYRSTCQSQIVRQIDKFDQSNEVQECDQSEVLIKESRMKQNFKQGLKKRINRAITPTQNVARKNTLYLAQKSQEVYQNSRNIKQPNFSTQTKEIRKKALTKDEGSPRKLSQSSSQSIDNTNQAKVTNLFNKDFSNTLLRKEQADQKIDNVLFTGQSKSIKNRLSRLERSFRHMQYQFNRVLQEQKQAIDFSTSGFSKSISVLPMDSQSARISTNGQKGPLLLFLEFSRQAGDLVIFIGTESQPEEKAALWCFDKFNYPKSRKTLLPKHAHTQQYKSEKETESRYDPNVWKDQYLYLSFVSEQGCSFSIRCEFAHQQRKKEMDEHDQGKIYKKKGDGKNIQVEIEEKINFLLNQASSKAEAQQQIEEQVRRQKHQQRLFLLNKAMSQGTGQNFIQHNREQTEDWARYQSVLKHQRPIEHLVHTREVEERKAQIDEKNLKFRLFQNVKWDVIKDRKALLVQQMMVRIGQKQRVKRFIAMIQRHQVIQKAKQSIALKKFHKMLKIRKLEAQMYIVTKYRQHYSKRRPSVQARIKQQLKFTINTFSQIVQPEIQEEAEHLLLSFMNWSAKIEGILAATREFEKQVTFVQRSFLDLYRDMQRRRHFLRYCFRQEHDCLLIKYTHLARRNSNYKKYQKVLSEGLDDEYCTHVIEEFFSGVCRKYMRYQQMIAGIVNQMLREKISVDDSNYESQLLYTNPDYDKFYPLEFSQLDTAIIRNEQRRLRHHIKNVFEKTDKIQTVLSPRDDQNTKTTNKKASNNSLVDKIMEESLFWSHSDKIDNQPVIIKKPIQPPSFRCIPDSLAMQSIVQKYIQMKLKGKDRHDRLPAFPRFVTNPDLP